MAEDEIDFRDDVSNKQHTPVLGGEKEKRTNIEISETKLVNLRNISEKEWNDELNLILGKRPQNMSKDEINILKSKFSSFTGLQEEVLSTNEELKEKITKLRGALYATGSSFDDRVTKSSRSSSNHLAVSALQRSLELAKAQIHATKCQSEAEMISLKEELHKCKTKIKSLEQKQDESTTMFEKSKKIKDENNVLQEENSNLKKQLERSTSSSKTLELLENQVEEYRKRCEDFRKRNTCLQDERIDLQRNVSKLEKHVEEKGNELSMLKKELEEERKSVETFRSQLHEMKTELRRSNEVARESERQREELVLEKKVKDEGVSALQETVDDLKAEKAQLVNLLQEKCNSEEMLKDQLKEKLEQEMKMKDSERNASAMGKEALSAKKILESKLNGTKKVVTHLKTEMKEKDKKIRNLESEIEQLEIVKNKFTSLDQRNKSENMDLEQRNKELLIKCNAERERTTSAQHEMDIMLQEKKLLQLKLKELCNEKDEAIKDLKTSLKQKGKKESVLHNEIRVLQKAKAEAYSQLAVVKSVKDQLIRTNLQLEKKNLSIQDMLDVKEKELTDMLEELQIKRVSEATQKEEILLLKKLVNDNQNKSEDDKSVTHKSEQDLSVEKSKLQYKIDHLMIQLKERENAMNMEMRRNIEVQEKLHDEIACLKEKVQQSNSEVEQNRSSLKKAQLNESKLEENVHNIQRSLDRQLLINSQLQESMDKIVDDKSRIELNHGLLQEKFASLENQLEKSKAMLNDKDKAREEGKNNNYLVILNELELTKQDLMTKEEQHMKKVNTLQEVINVQQSKVLKLQNEIKTSEGVMNIMNKTINDLKEENKEFKANSEFEPIVKSKKETSTTSTQTEVESEVSEEPKINGKNSFETILEEVASLKKTTMNDAFGLLSLLQSHISHAEDDNNKLRANIDSFQDKADKLEKSVSSKSDAIEELKKELDSTNKKVYEYEQHIATLESTITDSTNKLVLTKFSEDDQYEKIKQLKYEIRKLESSYNGALYELTVVSALLEEMKNKVRMKDSNLKVFQEQVSQYQEEVHCVKSSQVSTMSEIESYRINLKKLETAAEEQIKKNEKASIEHIISMKHLQKELDTANRTILLKEEALSILKSRLLFTEQWCRSIEEEIQIFGTEKNDLRRKLSSNQQELFYLEESLTKKENEYNSLKRKIQDSESEYDETLQRLNGEIYSYQFRVANLEEELKTAQTEKKNLTEELRTSKQDLIDTNRALSKCRNEFNDVKTNMNDSNERYKKERKQLEVKLTSSSSDMASYKEKLSFVEIESSKVYDKFMTAQVQVNDLRSRLSTARHEFSLEKQEMQDKIILSESKIEDLENDLSEMTNKLNCAEIQISVLETKNVEMQEMLTVSSFEVTKERENNILLENNLADEKLKMQILKRTLTDTSMSEGITEGRVDSLGEEFSILEKSIRDFKTKQQDLEENYTECQSQCALKEEKLTSNAKQLVKLEERLAVKINELESVESALTKSKNLNETLRYNMKQLNSYNYEVRNHLQYLQDLSSILEKDKIYLHEGLVACKELNETIDKNNEILRCKISKMETDLATQGRQLVSVEQENMELIGSLALSEQHVTSLEHKVESQEEYITHIEEKLSDSYKENESVSKKLIETSSKHANEIDELKYEKDNLRQQLIASEEKAMLEEEQQNKLQLLLIDNESSHKKVANDLMDKLKFANKVQEETEKLLADTEWSYQNKVSKLNAALVHSKDQQNTLIENYEFRLEVRAEVSDVNVTECAILRKYYFDTLRKMKNYQHKTDVLKSQNSEISHRARKIEKMKDSLQAHIPTLENKLKSLNTDFKKAKRHIKDLNQKYKIEIKLMETSKEEAEKKLLEITDLYKSTKAKLLQLENATEQLETSNLESSLHLRNKGEEIMCLKDKIKRIEKRYQSDLHAVQTEKSDLLVTLSAALNQMTEVSLNNLGSKESISSFELEVQKIRSNSNDDLRDSIDKFRSSLMKFEELEKINEASPPIISLPSEHGEIEVLVNDLKFKLDSKLLETKKLEKELEQAIIDFKTKEIENILFSGDVKGAICIEKKLSEMNVMNEELASRVERLLISLQTKEEECKALQTRAIEVEQLRAENSDYRTKMLMKEEEYDVVVSNLDEALENLKLKEDALAELSCRLNAESEVLMLKHSEVEALERKPELSKDEAAALEAEINRLNSELHNVRDLQEKVSLLEKSNNDSKAEIGALQADLIVAKKRLKVKDQKENDLKMKMNESQKQMMVMAKSLNETCEELVAAGKQLEELKTASDDKIENMQLVMQKMKKKLSQNESELQAYKTQLQVRHEEEADIIRMVQYLESSIEEKTLDEITLKNVLNVLQEKLHHVEVNEIDKRSRKKKARMKA